MKKKNNKKWALVLVLLLVVSIGYAALASNLKINGTTGVKSATWDVYWNNVQVTQGSVETTQGNQARITDQKKTQVEYSVTLNEPGDFYEFTVDAVNNGTIDAMIAANGIVNGVYSDSNYTQTATLPKTVSYTVTYADGTTISPKHLLAKKNGNTPTTETYKVRIEYKNDDSINPGDLNNTTDQTYYFKFSVNYVQADDSKIARNGGSTTPVCNTEPLEIGDTVDYTTTLNGVTLNNWKVFDEEDNYTYLIYGDYLPITAIDTNSIDVFTGGIHGVERDNTRESFLQALTTKSNWSSLLIGTLDETAIDESSNVNAWAIATPTMEQWVNSWNKTYPEDTIYIATTSEPMSDGNYGYYIGYQPDPDTYACDDYTCHFVGNNLYLYDKTGYNNQLYFPYHESLDYGEYGYWLASGSALAENETMSIYCDGEIYWGSDSYYFAIRPVIKLPTSVICQ